MGKHMIDGQFQSDKYLFGTDPSAVATRLIEQSLEKRFFIEEPYD